MLDSLERRFGHWAVPGIIRYLAILFAGVFLMSAVRPDFSSTLDFNLPKIYEGEWWRTITFIFASHVGSFNPMAVLFLIFGMLLTFSFSDGLEQQWGVFRTNLFVLWGFLSILAANFIFAHYFGLHFSMSGVYLGASILFAFATYNPKYTLMLFLIIPCPIWIIAALTGLSFIINAVSFPILGLFIALCLSNYLAVAVPMLLGGAKRKSATQMRRKKFSKQFSNKREAFHTCHSCGANDLTHPDEEFRVAKDGNDYCSQHLPE